MAELYDIGMHELRPDVSDLIEGALEQYPNSRFRRGVRLSRAAEFESYSIDNDADEFTIQACNYLLVYRGLTQDEQINLERPPGLVITRVITNDALAAAVLAAMSGPKV